MFDTILTSHKDSRQQGSGFAASAGLHLALIGAFAAASRLLMSPVDKPAHLSFPAAPLIKFLSGHSARAAAPHAARATPPHPTRTFRPTTQQPVRDHQVSPPSPDGETQSDSASGLATGSGNAGEGTGTDVGDVTGTSGGAVSAYLQVSHAPRRVAGEEAPPMASSLLMQLRGMHAVVLAKIQINALGQVEDVAIVNSTAPQLDDLIRRHILATWRFEAPTSAGRPTGVQYLQSFRFNF
jgi:outer membrane biosynthesis protein TonB